MKRRKSKHFIVFTVKDKGAGIVRDAEAIQRLLDIAARREAEEGIRQGLEDPSMGRTRLARQFFEEFESSSLK